MFNSKTLFIVGAGASKEAGLPIGSELSNVISKLLYFSFSLRDLERGDQGFLFKLRQKFNDSAELNAHLAAARRISEGIHLATSIDNYIDTHRESAETQLCGKAAIVHSILKAERSSLLYVKNTGENDFLEHNRLDGSWYIEFAKILFEGRSLDGLDEVFSNISIVCFNYDRCIEHFLIYVLQPLYAIDKKQAEALVSGLKIYHPYGTVGALQTSHARDGVQFGQSPDGVDIFALSSKIKTYTEQIEDDHVLRGIRDEVESADTLVFLGFGFHRQNMALLNPGKEVGGKRVFATASGISKHDVGVVKEQVWRLFLDEARAEKAARSDNPNIQIREDLRCHGLFEEYRRSLSLI